MIPAELIRLIVGPLEGFPDEWEAIYREYDSLPGFDGDTYKDLEKIRQLWPVGQAWTKREARERKIPVMDWIYKDLVAHRILRIVGKVPSRNGRGYNIYKRIV